MEIKQVTTQKTFTIEHNEKIYHVDYLNSNGQILGLINRNNWEIYDEEGEELQINLFSDYDKKQKETIKKNIVLANKLIKYCIKHFK